MNVRFSCTEYKFSQFFSQYLLLMLTVRLHSSCQSQIPFPSPPTTASMPTSTSCASVSVVTWSGPRRDPRSSSTYTRH